MMIPSRSPARPPASPRQTHTALRPTSGTTWLKEATSPISISIRPAHPSLAGQLGSPRLFRGAKTAGRQLHSHTVDQFANRPGSGGSHCDREERGVGDTVTGRGTRRVAHAFREVGPGPCPCVLACRVLGGRVAAQLAGEVVFPRAQV